MAEWCDQWASEGKRNLWGTIPSIVEMQSEGGAAGAVHGALQTGTLTTTFTASQGLLLMIPNMFKIAGELLPDGLPRHGPHGGHARALDLRRSQRRHGLPLDRLGHARLGLACRRRMDFALISQAATLRSRIPFIHFFDGFRTSHEVSEDRDADRRGPARADRRQAHRRASRPRDDARTARCCAARRRIPDAFFQARETVQSVLRRLRRTSRRRSWTSSPSRWAAATTCSITSARPMPSA